jgi:hypothetical protein
LRIDAFNDWSDGVLGSNFETKGKQIIAAALAQGIYVNVDFHTWYTTWDNSFDDNAASNAANRATYLSYISDGVSKMDVAGVKAFMVLNEPQAQSASASENNFILSIISTAHGETSKPVGVRFMCGYSPSTGHYSASIDSATDFLCRNTYWDPRNPSGTVFGTTQAKMNAAIAAADSLGKELWFTEFGTYKADLENQRSFVEAFVSYALEKGISRLYCWVSQPVSGSGETYNIFNGWTPNPAWYELVSSG